MKKFVSILTTLALILSMATSSMVTVSAAETAPEVGVSFVFTDSAITASGASSGYKIEGTALTINEAGTYKISGSCTEGSISVKKETTGVVLLLDGLTLSSSNTAPLTLKKSAEATLYLSGTNTLTDKEDASTEDTNEDFEGAAIKVKSEGAKLTIKGDGVLTADGSACKNGIKAAATSEIEVADGHITVKAAKHGLAADGKVKISGGTLNIDAENDGIVADPDEDDTESEAAIEISGGNIVVNAGDKGLKAAGDITISGGALQIVAADDAVHSNDDIVITGGAIGINAGDDAIHADTSLTLGIEGGSGPNITVLESYEGYEAGNIYIYGGVHSVRASDDGVNAAGGSSSGSDPWAGGADNFKQGGRAGGMMGRGSGFGGFASPERGGGATAPEGLNQGGTTDGMAQMTPPDGAGQDGNTVDGLSRGFGGRGNMAFGGNTNTQTEEGFTAVSTTESGMGGRGGMGGFGGNSGDYSINIYGGKLYVNADGDGLDSNGDINISGGEIEVWGQSAGDNEPLDCDGTLTITGGTVFAAGSSGMGMASPATGSQPYQNFSGRANSGSTISVDVDGNTVYTAVAPKSVSYLFYSAPNLGSSISASVAAGENAETANTAAKITVTINGNPVAWTDAEPYIDANNRTMVPFRAVAEALGLEVEWDSAAREAVFSDGTKTIYFPIGSALARTSDGSGVQMDTEAVIVNSRTYAPIRYLAEYFGYTVGWNQQTKTVSIVK